MSKSQSATILSGKFWKAYWITMRPYLTFVSGSAGLVGLAFIENPRIFRVVIAFIPLFLSYGLGQALTDCFQTDTDSLSSPYRPLVKGIISRKQVLSISLIGLTLGVLILAYLNPILLLFGGVAVIGLFTYTPFKRTWWGGPPWNSWIVALLPIMGRLADRGYRISDFVSLEDSYSLAFLFVVFAVFFGYANFVVMGYFKDISADRKSRYRTFPVVFGWVPTLVLSDVIGFAAAFFTGCALHSIGRLSIFGVAVFFIAVAVNIYAQIKIHRIRDENRAYGPIVAVVRAFILYCAAIIITLRINWIIFMAIFYVLFEVALRLRTEESQV